MYIRRADFASTKPDTKPIKILHFTDVRLNWTTKQDENNDEIMYTKKFRHWNENAASVKALEKAMDYAETFDKTVITGDVLDFMSSGAMELMDKYVWNRDPNITVTLGNHEYVRQMETDKTDETSLEAVLRFWKNFGAMICITHRKFSAIK